MAQVYPLVLTKPDDIILVDTLVKKHSALLVLDTGATNTIIDLNTLLIAGYSFKSLSGKRKQFETANGIIEAELILLKSLIVWNRTFEITSPYEGVLGLDILKQFCIKLDFPANRLELS
jgi:hypothetical protein